MAPWYRGTRDGRTRREASKLSGTVAEVGASPEVLPRGSRVDRDGRRHLDAGGGAVVRAALAGSGGDAVVVAPPFTVEQEHIDMIGWALDAALGAVESRLRGQA